MLAGFARRQWVVVVVAALVGAVLAGVWAVKSAPEPGFSAGTRVRLATGVVGVPSVPNADAVIAAVGLPDVRAAVAETLGVDAVKVPQAAAAVDGKNTAAVVVTVKDSDAARAEKASLAYAQAAADRVRMQVEPNYEYQRAQFAKQQERLPEMQKQLDRLTALMSGKGVSPVEYAALSSAASSLQMQILTVEDRLDTAALQLEQIARYAYVDGTPKAKAGSSTGALLAGVIRGLLLGLIAGLIVAIVRERVSKKKA